MWQVEYATPPPPFTVTVEVCGKPLRMEVDTGASVSVIAKSRLLRLLPSVPVQPSQVFLRSYSGVLNMVQGKADVHVKFHDKEADLPIFLAGDGSPTLLGRNWMQELGIGVSDVEANIHALSDVKHLVQDYAKVFEDGLGTFKGATASLHVPSDAPPRFFKPRPLPYALTDGVTQEIQRLIRDSIIVPVKTARWAAPIVPVTKGMDASESVGTLVSPLTQSQQWKATPFHGFRTCGLCWLEVTRFQRDQNGSLSMPEVVNLVFMKAAYYGDQEL
ncbi:hypothetical protein MTO96_039105 [Rhipicephalus appendiculatus]